MFVAVVPPQEAVQHLREAVESRPRADTHLRWTPVEHWHLTLAFLPAVPADVLPELSQRLARAARRRSVEDAQLTGAGAFPRQARATVVWVGVRTQGRQLQRLAEGCRAAARRVGLETPEGRFRPHLTLARLSRPGDVRPLVSELASYAGPVWPVEHVRLVASHLGKGPDGRPRYELVSELPLARA